MSVAQADCQCSGLVSGIGSAGRRPSLIFPANQNPRVAVAHTQKGV
jgi:hypothetical protein